MLLIYVFSGQLHHHELIFHDKLQNLSPILSDVVISEINDRLNTIQSSLPIKLNLNNQTQGLTSRCAFPFIYNKPHKTASTKIQADILHWAKSQRRPAYACNDYLSTASMQMRECIPEEHSGCAIIATHVILSDVMRNILRSRIGDFWTVTSTRLPRDRVLSLFLQMRITTSEKIHESLPHLHTFLTSFNPWSLYNYHTGENRIGTCPMTTEEKILLRDVVNRYDVVIDANLTEHSNVILASKNLFTLSEKVSNVRGAKNLVLTPELNDLLKKKLCVEEELHFLFRMRMASAYQKITGKPCLQRSREPKITCF